MVISLCRLPSNISIHTFLRLFNGCHWIYPLMQLHFFPFSALSIAFLPSFSLFLSLSLSLSFFHSLFFALALALHMCMCEQLQKHNFSFISGTCIKQILLRANFSVNMLLFMNVVVVECKSASASAYRMMTIAAATTTTTTTGLFMYVPKCL